MKMRIALFFSAFTAFSACGQAGSVGSKSYGLMLKKLLDHSVPEVSVERAAADSTAIFLDAREKKEFDVSQIAGARWVGYDDFELGRVAALDKNVPIIVYCSVGYRSEKISKKLLNAGFLNVKNLYGGIFEWKNAGRVVVDSTKKETENVHAYSKTWGIWLRKGRRVY